MILSGFAGWGFFLLGLYLYLSMKINHLINNPESISKQEVEEALLNSKVVTVQFAEKIYHPDLLEEINRLCKHFDERFVVRFYGHYSDTFDLKGIIGLTHVKSLYIDSLRDVDNFNLLTNFKELEALSVGYYHLKDTEFLSLENLKNLRVLTLMETKSKSLNLEHLSKMTKLSSLIISGHNKNIEAIGSLVHLKKLNLNSISKVSLNFINQLQELEELNIALGGRKNIDEIGEMNSLRILSIIRVRGFNSMNNLERFNSLEKLNIEDNINLLEVDFSRASDKLNELKIINCKTLNNAKSIAVSKGLQTLVIYETGLDFDHIVDEGLPSKLETFVFKTTKAKIDKSIKERIIEMGYKTR